MSHGIDNPRKEQCGCPDCMPERTYTQSDLNAALALRTREAANQICIYCRSAEFPSPRWSKANYNGKHFVIRSDESDMGKEVYCLASAILALIKPDESAALAEHDRRVRLEEAEFTRKHWIELGLNEFAQWIDKRLAALRETGEEKQP